MLNAELVLLPGGNRRREVNSNAPSRLDSSLFRGPSSAIGCFFGVFGNPSALREIEFIREIEFSFRGSNFFC